MRLFNAAILTLVISGCAFGQTYTISTVAGNGTAGYSGDNGPAASAELNYPYGVAVDSAGDVYIADAANSRIRKVSNGVITTVAGNGTAGYSGDNGPATSAQLNVPESVAVDSAGNLYIADYDNNRIRKVSNGVITTVAGSGTAGYSGDNGPATSALLYYPQGVAVDSAGNLYIADAGNNCIRKISNGVITTVAGSGTAGYSGDNGPATSALLYVPESVAVDSAGSLYIGDRGNSCVRKVSNGVITTVAGSGYAGFSGDNGPATSAELYDLYGVAVDSAGSLYIGDRDNDRIRKVSNGVITTVAGNWPGGYSGDNGPATSALLNYPQGVAVDSGGKLYIADEMNNRIRVLIPSGSSCSASVAPLAWSPAASGGNLTVTIQTSSSSCAWAVQNLPDWITFSGSAAGSVVEWGPGSITLSVAANSGASRAGTVSVAGVLVQVNQQGGYVPCAYALSPGSQAFLAAGGTGTVSVATTSGCSWTASSNVTWVTMTGGVSGTGNGTVTYQVAANNGGVRSGSLTVAGLPFAVSQAGASAAGKTYTIKTFAGNGTAGYSGDNGLATSAQLNGPSGVAVDAAGNVYIADRGNQRIRKVSNGVITTVAGNGIQGYSGDGGPATDAELNVEGGLAIDGSGSLYIADVKFIATYDDVVIRKVSSANGTITAVAGGCVPSCTTGIISPGLPGTEIDLLGDGGIAVDQAGTLYVARWMPNLIDEFSPTGAYVISFRGAYAVLEVAVDPAGNLYAVDSCNIYAVSSTTGILTTVAGNGTCGYAGDGGPAVQAELNPSGIAFDTAGNLYIADTANQRIRMVANGVITLVAGSGTAGYSGDNGLATSAQLNGPSGVAVDAAGNVYIADSLNNRIRVLTPSGAASLPVISGVSNAASGLAAIAPNTWVSIYGANFAAAGFSGDWSKSITGGNLPTTLDGVSVSVGGIPAYVSFVSSGQINILTPNVAAGSTSVTVTAAAGTSTPVTVTSQQFSPAFFPWPNGQPVATHLDYSWAVKNGTFAGATTVPAKPGEYIILWGTGFGPTTPTAPTGVTIPASTTYYTANPVFVTIGSATASVYGTALTSGFAGLYQVVAMVPATLSNGDYSLVATVGGVATAATTLTVHN